MINRLLISTLVCLVAIGVGVVGMKYLEPRIEAKIKGFVINHREMVIAEIVDKVTRKNLNEKLVSHLKIYSARDENGDLKLIRLGRSYDGGYVTPVKALQSSDVLLGYGIANDNSFEDRFSQVYGKPSYGFDCGIDHIASKSPLFHFIPQCISTDKFVYPWQTSSKKISSYAEEIKALDLGGKKVLIKMDIEGAEYEAFPGILNHYADITGIVLEIHISTREHTMKGIKLLSDLDEHFLLLHVHGNNCGADPSFIADNLIGSFSTAVELTYINKALTTDYHLAENQSHPLPIDMPNCTGSPDLRFDVN